MSKYITVSPSGQLFDEDDNVLHTISQTAQDVEDFYDSFTKKKDSGALPKDQPVTPDADAPDPNPPDKAKTATDYLPIIFGVGVGLVIIWMIVKK